MGMHSYCQSTGDFLLDGDFLAKGYSGNGAGLNNPDAQEVIGHGPIPQGLYTILPPITDQKVGPVAMHLIPNPANEMFGRSAFFIHGDSAQMDHTASDGCIILDRNSRLKVAEAVARQDDQLMVVA